MRAQQLQNKNQFIIEDGENIYFQSYKSVCAKINKETGELVLGGDWDYSQTTSKHLNLFISTYEHIINNMRGFHSITNKKAYLQKLIDKKQIILDYNL